MKEDIYQVGVKQYRWTELAKECYQRKDCVGCFYQEYLGKIKCKMKLAVRELVRTLGKPEDVEIKQVIEDNTNDNE